MSASAAQTSDLAHVDAVLNYLAPMADRPRNYTFDPPPGIPRSNSTHEAHTVPISDARAVASDISLDREGFAVLHHQSAVKDFWDEDEVRRVYYPEVQRVLAEATGASKVYIFDHTLRRRVRGVDDRALGTPRQPATRVHVDHTAKSGPQRVRDFFGDEAEELLRGRVQVINLWRPIRGPLRDAPLAVCDAGSVAPEDLVPSDLVYQNRVGETYGVPWGGTEEMAGLPRDPHAIYCFSNTILRKYQGKGYGASLKAAFIGRVSRDFKRIYGHARPGASQALNKKFGARLGKTYQNWFETGEDFRMYVLPLGK